MTYLCTHSEVLVYRVPDFEQRRTLLHAFVESEAIELLRAGRRAEAQRMARKLLAAAEESDADQQERWAAQRIERSAGMS